MSFSSDNLAIAKNYRDSMRNSAVLWRLIRKEAPGRAKYFLAEAMDFRNKSHEYIRASFSINKTEMNGGGR